MTDQFWKDFDQAKMDLDYYYLKMSLATSQESYTRLFAKFSKALEKCCELTLQIYDSEKMN